MPGTKITVTLKHKKTGEKRTVEVTGTTQTQESAEKHVAHQYGDGALGRGAYEARQWEVVPASGAAPADDEKAE